MSRIFLLDADLNGIDSIAKRIESGAVVRIPCGTFEEYDAACNKLRADYQPGDRVILDTFTTMLSTTRGDFKHGTDPKASIWEQRNLYFGDKQALNAYQAAGNMTMRGLKNLRHTGFYVTALCHEDEALDETTLTTKRAPKANPEARDMLIAAASDVFRLVENTTDKIDGDGQVVLRKGARLLHLRRTQETLAKFHVDIDLSPKIADGLTDPTMEKLCEHLGKIPTFLVVYGLPGVGKTTFATS